MDRHDERRRVDADHPDRVERVDEDLTRDEVREGDVLGLGGAAVPKAPGDPSASNDPESKARRRSRALGEDEGAVQTEDPDRQRSGATGIDMGAGGQGTHVSGK
jgi:hypothetical protein